MKIQLKNIIEIITLSLLVLFAVSFRGNDMIFLTVLGIGAVISFAFQRKIVLNIELCLLILTFFSYYYIFLCRGSQYLQLYYAYRSFLAPIFAYLFGYAFTNSNHKKALKIFIAVAVGRMIHGLLNEYISFNALTANHRSVVDFWTGNEYVATLQATYFIFAIAIGAWLLIKPKLMHKAIGTGLLILSLISGLLISSRTAIVMVAVAVVYIIIFNQRKNAVKKSLILISLLAVIFVAYNYNLVGIRSFIEHSNLMQRMNERGGDFLSTTRAQLSMQVLRSLFDYPFGDMPFRYAHNLWLDVARQTGLIPFVLIILYAISTIYNLYRVNKQKVYLYDFYMLVNLLYLIMFMNFFTEPILEGAPTVFYIFCMINGAVHSLVKAPITYQSIDLNARREYK